MVEIPVIPESAPFTAEQRLWLNGFLAGCFARMPVPASPAPSALAERAVPLLILFGSQTGTAQNLAKRLGKTAATRGFRARVMDAADFAKVDWKAESNLLIATSTYGDGEMPDNAQAFWDWLQTDAAHALADVRFSVLALGDRNYSDFCGAGRKMDVRLEELGAKRVFPRSDCDVDYNAAATSWMEGVLACLLEQDTQGASAPKSVTLEASSSDAIANGNESPNRRPRSGRLAGNIRLSGPNSAKEVRHYQINLEDSEATYEAGDALGVLPVNCPELVNEVLAAVQCTGEECLKLGEEDMPLREALARHLDITKPSRQLLATIAERTPGSELARLLKGEHREELKQWLWGRDVIDLLHLLPQPIPWLELAKLLKKLAARLYSISSSAKAHPGEVHLTVSAVRYESYGRNRKGVASTFLADRLCQKDSLKVFMQASPGFKPPSSSETPMIMVGPGTGIAPFRGFLQERQAIGAKGRHWLFFGEQKRQCDFYYEEELTAWLKSGHLTRLDLAFSRDQADKVYVQHRMLEQAANLWSWLEDGAHFYVCGDASRMAKDVDTALHQVAQKAGGKRPEEAKAWVAQLKADKRYQRDVY